MKKIFNMFVFLGLMSILLVATSCSGMSVLDPVDVHFVTDGGTTYESIKVEPTEILELPTPEKLGYEFVGWYDNSTFSGEAIFGEYEVIKSVTLFAKWRPYAGIVKFESNGGTQYNSLYFAAQYIELPIPTREGHNFVAWYDNSEFTGEALSGKYLPKGDVTLYAKWEAVGGTIKFVSNGGTNYADLVFAGQLVTIPTPTRAGYKFVGWYDNSEFTGEVYSGDILFEESVTLYAKWEAVNGTIKFVSNGGTQYEDITVSGQYVKLPTPEKANYTFAGWYDNSEFTGEALTGNYLPEGEVTLYAKWVSQFYLVSFESNGGTTHEDMMSFGEAITLPTPFKYGYKFLGWYDNAALEGSPVEESYVASGSVTLYAKWEQITYLYLYYGELIDSKRYEYAIGDTITVSELNALYTPEDLVVTDFLGYDHQAPFMHWAYEGADENSHTKVTEDILVGAKHIILVAQYDYSSVPAAEHLKYDHETGIYTTTGKVAHVFAEAPTETPYVYSLTVSFAKGTSGAVGPAFRMKMPNTNYQYESGCNYLCPGLDSASGVLQISKVLNGSWSRLISNTALTALPKAWQDKFNGTETNQPITVTISVVDYGTSFEVYIDNDLAITYSDANVLATMNGTGLGVRSSTTPAKLINPSVHHGYTVNYDTNVDGLTVNSTKWYAGKIELPMLLQDNVALAGWYYDEALTKPVDDENFVIAEDTTLYAKWSEEYHVVSFDSLGGSQVASVNWVQGKLILPDAPTKMNHKFIDWYYDEACTKLVDPYTFDTDSDITLYAKWRLYASHIVDNGDGTYTYNKKTEAVLGIVEKPIPDKWYYNEYSQTISLVKGAASVGLAFRMNMPSDYTYETTGSYYLSVQFCGKDGLRISQVNNGKWSRLIPNNKDHSLAALPQSYQDKYNATATDAYITVKLTVRDYGSYFEVYLDDELAYTYGQYGETIDLTQYTGNGYGIRSSAGTVATFKDVTVTTARGRAYFNVIYKQDYAEDHEAVMFEDAINEFEGHDSGVLYKDPADVSTAYYHKFVGWSLTKGGEVVDLITGDSTLYAVYEEKPLVDPIFINFKVEGEQLITKVVERNTALAEYPSFDLPYQKANGNKVFGSGFEWQLNGVTVDNSHVFDGDVTLIALINERVETRNGVIVTQDEDGDDVYRFFGNTGVVNQYGGRYGIGLDHLTTITDQTEAKMSDYSFNVTVPSKPTSEVGVRMIIFVNDNGTNTQVTGDSGSKQYFLAIHWNPHNGSFYITGKLNSGGQQFDAISLAKMADCGYKQKYSAWTSGEQTFQLRSVYGLDSNGDAWFKFYVDNDLLCVYGDNAVMFEGEQCYGVTYKYDSFTAQKHINFMNYAKDQSTYAGLLDYGVGISMWQNTSLCGGYIEYSKVTNRMITDTYTINYESNLEGVTVDSTNWTAGRLELPELTGEDGAILEGWYYDANLTQKVDPDNFVTNENTTIYAKWSRDFFVISFDSNDGTACESMNWVSGVIELPTPIRTNYILEGWYYDEALTKAVDSENFSVTQNVTLYAKWRRPYSHLIYNEDGSYTGPASTKTVAILGDLADSTPEEGYVEYSADVSFAKGTSYGGIMFRATVTQDYTFESAGETYFALKFAYAKLRFSKTVNGARSIIKEIPFPAAFQAKYNATASEAFMSGNILVRDYGNYFNIYVDGDLIYTYSDQTVLNQINGNGYGVRIWPKYDTTISNYVVSVKNDDHMVSFETNGGTAMSPIKWHDGPIPFTPTLVNQVLDCWCLDSDLTQPVDFATFRTDSDITLYAKYRLPLSYIVDNGDGTYTNNVTNNAIKVIGLVDGTPDAEHYIEYKQTVSVLANTGSSGIAFRMSINGDHQYEKDQNYLFVQYCTRFIRIGYILNGGYKLIKDVKTTSLPTAWYEKCTAAADTDYVTSDFSVRDYGDRFEVYVDGELAYTYSDATILSNFNGTGYGIRNSVDSVVTFSNISAKVVAIATEE